ncbi:MAG: hypothetical protein ACHQII_02325 [Bacteroidia bacterium]
MIKKVLLFLLVTLVVSCRTIPPPTYYYGIFKFKQRADEVFLKPSFVSFLKTKPFCSMVLRVPVKPNNIVEEEKYNNRSMYFAIEKTLIENNFTVNDRSIFEKIMLKDSTAKPQTDLILELVDYKPVNYYTNKVIPETSTDEAETLLPKYFYFTGAQAQFKITHIKTNEVVAAFVLNYTPCTKGCRMKYTTSGLIEEVDGDFKTRKKNGYEAIDEDKNDLMFAELAKRLVTELRKKHDN